MTTEEDDPKQNLSIQLQQLSQKLKIKTQTDDYFEVKYHDYTIIKNDLVSYKTCRIYLFNQLIYSAKFTKPAEREINEHIQKITGFQFPEEIELNGVLE